jgi:putative aminopeptidase FrvX
MYSSDCSTALRTFDVKAALIGPGVYASHGYERSHVEGVKNTFALLCAYLEI